MYICHYAIMKNARPSMNHGEHKLRTSEPGVESKSRLSFFLNVCGEAQLAASHTSWKETPDNKVLEAAILLTEVKEGHVPHKPHTPSEWKGMAREKNNPEGSQTLNWPGS